ncbi:MAG: TetR/AcrR family transcriptional regulator [Tabrizicola sp.]|nr:TetR/AcrR family transcriptional regulator [Tabrizicola sp.]
MAQVAEQAVRRGRKYDQVLEGARIVFLRDGFGGANVDDIAREANVSKATIYAYFPDKQLLFLEVARMEFRRQAEEAEASAMPDMSVRGMLTLAAERIAAFVMSEFGQRMYRIVVGEGERFPGLGQEFYACGPGLIHDRLVHHLSCHCAEGDLQIDDLDLAADQFAQLCKATIVEKLLLGMATEITEAEVARSVAGAVEMFLARYSTKG